MKDILKICNKPITIENNLLQLTDSPNLADAELSMINILAAIHEKDYKRAMKLTNKISGWIGVLPWAKNVRPEEELLWWREYHTWKNYIKKYIQKVNG